MPKKRHLLKKIAKHKSYIKSKKARDKTLAAKAIPATSSSSMFSEMINKAKIVASFAADTIKVSSEYFLGKAIKNCFKYYGGDGPLASALPILSKKVKASKVIDEKLNNITSTVKYKDAVKATIYLSIFLLSSKLTTGYNPWYYAACLSGSVASKIIMNRIKSQPKPTAKEAFFKKILKLYLYKSMANNALCALGLTSKSWAPLFFLLRPILVKGYSDLITQRIMPIVNAHKRKVIQSFKDRKKLLISYQGQLGRQLSGKLTLKQNKVML